MQHIPCAIGILVTRLTSNRPQTQTADADERFLAMYAFLPVLERSESVSSVRTH